MIIIDSSVWLFALKKDFNPFIKEKVETILAESDVAINGIIALELLGGTRSEREYKRLKGMLDGLYYIEAIRSLWDFSSKLAYKLRRKGVTIPYTDIFIAASALKEKAVLLHADYHFDLVTNHVDLKVESLTSYIK